MSPQRSERELEQEALRIVEEVLEKDQELRAKHLETKCGDDPRLHSRVTKLLGHEQAGELEQPEGLPSLPSLVPEMCEDAIPGGRVGSYELVRPIARGGMGWVYEAIQDKPQRRVALKILRRGFESDEAQRRFQLESEVLAYLKHPGIAQVYEAGVHLEQGVLGESPMPFLALEFVEGARSITGYAREEQLQLNERIALFLDACDAVHYGHLRGVIHRDLKPANILVDAAGKVKVIDFGIARVVTAELDTTLDFTSAGQLLGTLGAMSPEQFGSDPKEVDMRSDVYSLGVLLYELLVGRRPFELKGKSVAEVAQIVQAGNPINPRSLLPELAKDLEAVLLKSLSVERELRYGSIRELADDLQRYLQREPVLARAPGILQRTRLFVYRHPLPVGLVGALVLVLAVATGISLNRVEVAESARLAMHKALGAAQDATERAEAETKRAEAATALAEAAAEEREAALARAEAAVVAKQEALEAELALKEDLLAFQDTVIINITERLASWNVSLRNRVEILRICIATFESMTKRSREDATVLAALGDLKLRLGDKLGNPNLENLGLYEEARATYAKAQEIADELLAYDQDTEAHRYGRYLEALLLTRAAAMSGVERDLEAACDELEASREVFGALREDFPKDVRYVMGLADACVALASYAAELERDVGFIEDCYRQGIELIEGLGILARTDPECVRFLEDNYGQLATVLGHNGQTLEAIEILEASMERNRERIEKDLRDEASALALANNHLMLADVYLVSKEYSAADEHAASSHEALIDLIDRSGADGSRLTSLALTCSMRGSINLAWSDELRRAKETFKPQLLVAQLFLEDSIALIEERLELGLGEPLLPLILASAEQNLKRVEARLERF